MDGAKKTSETTSNTITCMNVAMPMVDHVQSINDPLKLSGDFLGDASMMAKSVEVGGDIVDAAGVIIDVGKGVADNIENDTPVEYIISDAMVDFRFAATGMAIGIAVESIIPSAGTIAGAVLGFSKHNVRFAYRND